MAEVGGSPPRRRTRAIRVGRILLGGGHPVAVQSMAATRTRDVAATLAQLRLLAAAGADIVRVAVDSAQDVAALAEIGPQAGVPLSVDLQENYQLVVRVAPHVQKVRYNPGHLHHHERHRSAADKVAFIAAAAAEHDCAVRIGVNCGSVDPSVRARFAPGDRVGPMLASALEHCELLDRLGFSRYCVSLKDSDPRLVVEANRRFARQRPDVPLHLGVTEAGMPPEGIFRTRSALEPLLAAGLGDTLRVSLTVPAAEKGQEVAVGRQILADVAAGRFLSEPCPPAGGLTIVSCPSCSRVENEAFVELAQRVRAATAYARQHPLTIAVMGCRVNGPGETDDADLGLWCGPAHVHLKRGRKALGQFSYDEIVPRLLRELDEIIASR